MALGSNPTPADRKWSQPALTPVRLFSLIAFCGGRPRFLFLLSQTALLFITQMAGALTPTLLIAKGAEGGVLASS